MPKSWSDKDERKYEHIKEGYEEQGKSEEEAEEIAARSRTGQRILTSGATAPCPRKS